MQQPEAKKILNECSNVTKFEAIQRLNKQSKQGTNTAIKLSKIKVGNTHKVQWHLPSLQYLKDRMIIEYRKLQ